MHGEPVRIKVLHLIEPLTQNIPRFVVHNNSTVLMLHRGLARLIHCRVKNNVELHTHAGLSRDAALEVISRAYSYACARIALGYF